MAEPVDYFMQGVGLGQRSRSIRNQEDQFRTNLAERARQANREFDLQQKQTESQIARNNLYVEKLKYDLDTSRTEDDRNTLELESLKKFQAELEAAKENPAAALPMPPSGLTGANLQSAINLRETHDQSRKERSSYIVFKQQEDDYLDLVTNYGRPADTSNLSPQDQAALVDRARMKRANQEAMQIVKNLGLQSDVLFRTADVDFGVAGTRKETLNMVDAFYDQDTGRLNKEALENQLRPLSPFEVSSQQQYSTGATAKNFKRKLTQEEDRQQKIASVIKSFGSQLYLETEDLTTGEKTRILNPLAASELKKIDPSINVGGGGAVGSGMSVDEEYRAWKASQQN